MNKGFSLIEVVMYISLLSLLIVGVFSSLLSSIYFTQKTPVFVKENYDLLIKNFHEE